MKKSALIQGLLIGLVWVIILVLLIQNFFPDFNIMRLIIAYPIMAVVVWFAPRTHGYVLSDKGIATCKIGKEGYSHIQYINWEDVCSIEYKFAHIKYLGADKIIVRSASGTRICVDDSQVDFKKIVSTICEKTESDNNFKKEKPPNVFLKLIHRIFKDVQ